MRPGASDKALRRLGEAIRTLRKERGFSQEEFAFECELHRTYIGALERGERNLSFRIIHRVAHALRMKPSELFAKAEL